jgi:tetrahydromethanopterin S-methyltransferase subunit F
MKGVTPLEESEEMQEKISWSSRSHDIKLIHNLVNKMRGTSLLIDRKPKLHRRVSRERRPGIS